MGIKVKIIEKSKPGHPEEKYFTSRRSQVDYEIEFKSFMLQNLFFSARIISRHTAFGTFFNYQLNRRKLERFQ